MTSHMTQHPEARRDQPARRGVILIFIVVLLVLLAIMGTAFLASARADRQEITSRGAGDTSGIMLAEPGTFNGIADDAKDLVLKQLVIDLYNVGPTDNIEATGTGPSDFQDPADPDYRAFRAGASYQNIDAYGPSDPHLASLLPEFNGSDIVWPWTSAPLVRNRDEATANLRDDFFVDPRNFLRTSDRIDPAARQDAQPSAAQISRSNVPFETVERTRMYPAFGPTTTLAISNGTNPIAADADGDGIADSWLMPWAIDLTQLNTDVARYEDPANPGVYYFWAYRIVDNSAKINVNTALRVTNDYDVSRLTTSNASLQPATRPATSVSDVADPARRTPNLGFHRSNVGLLELLDVPLDEHTDRSPDRFSPTDELLSEYTRLLNFRLGQGPGTTPFTLTGPTGINSIMPETGPASAATPQSLGDVLEHGLARRLDAPSRINSGGQRYSAFGTSDTASIAFRNGLIDPDADASDLEKVLEESTWYTAINFADRKDRRFGAFPANAVEQWFEWTQDFTNTADGVDAGGPLAGPNAFSTGGSNAFMRSLRPILTAQSGVTALASARRPTVPVPWTDADPQMERSLSEDLENAGVLTKVSVSTATVGQLWRAFWLSMLEYNEFETRPELLFSLTPHRYQPPPPAPEFVPFTTAPMFASASRKRTGNFHPGAHSLANDANLRLGAASMALIRSAVAAVNAVELRDNAEDQGQDLEPEKIEISGLEVRPGQRLRARVFGLEKQPFITEVVIDRSRGKRLDPADPSGGTVESWEPIDPWVGVVLQNPHDTDLDLAQFCLAIVTHDGTSYDFADTVTSSVLYLSDLFAGQLRPANDFGDRIVITSGTDGGGPGTFDAELEWSTPPISDPADPSYPGRDRRVPYAEPPFASQREIVEANPEFRNLLLNLIRSEQSFDLVLLRINNASLPVATLSTSVPCDLVQIDPKPVDVGLDPTQPDQVVIDRRIHEYIRDARNVEEWKFVYMHDPSQGFNAIEFGAETITGTDEAEQIQAWKDQRWSFDAGSVYPTVGGGTSVRTVFQAGAPPIQIQNFDPDFGDPANDANRFPFGSSIAREGDITKIPYIGAYVIIDDFTGKVIEYVPVGLDAWLASRDTEYRDASGGSLVSPIDEGTPLGRFVALTEADYENRGFKWTKRVFDYMKAAHAPNSLNVPEVHPDVLATAARLPEPFVDANAIKSSPRTLIQGLVNINTAPPIVLRMLPWKVLDAGSEIGRYDPVETLALVNEIVQERATNGPFDSILSLSHRFTDPTSPLFPSLAVERFELGDPSVGNQPNVIEDFEYRTRELTRVSNLATTRSDSYTVYIIVQAWRTDGNGPANSSSNVRMVAEQRRAFVVDRSAVSPAAGPTISDQLGALRVIDIDEVR
jgi:hypothetical protein